MAFQQQDLTTLIFAPDLKTPNEIRHPFTLTTNQYKFEGVLTKVTNRNDSVQTDDSWDGILIANAIDSARDFAIFSLSLEDNDIDSTRVLFASPSIEKLAGFSNRYDFISWLQKMHPDDRTRFENTFNFMLESREKMNEDIRIAGDEENKWQSVRIIISVSETGSGQDTILTGMLFDVSESENLKQLLYETRRINLSLMDSVAEAVFLLDNSGLIKSANSQAEIVFFRESKALAGDMIYDLFPSQCTHVLADSIKKAVDNNRDIEFELMENDNLKYQVKLIHCATNCLLAVFNQLYSETRLTKHSELNFDILTNLMNSISEDILIVDERNRIINCNKSFELDSGYELSSIMMHNFIDLFGLSDIDDISITDDRPFESYNQVHLTKSDNTKISVSLGINHLLDSSHRKIGKMIIVHINDKKVDTTDRDSSVSQIDPLIIQAGYQKFMHDLNNILSTIIGNIDLAKINVKAKKLKNDYFKEIEHAALQAREMLIRMSHQQTNAEQLETDENDSDDLKREKAEKLRILVMDDKSEVRQVVGQILSELGYQTAFAADGAEAIKLYKESLKENRKFDAIIMDVNIPNGMGGEETVKRLRQIDPEVNAIVFSGCHNMHIMSNFHKYGFQGFVSKPFTLDELNRIVSDTIRRSHSEGKRFYRGQPD